VAHAVIPGLDAAAYARHPTHGELCTWAETNCYVDVWIEVLHALGLEPLAALPFAVAVDFEGDQWTFFKPPIEDLRALFGVDVQELTVWRPLLDHAVEHLAAGKLIMTEADAFWLPDTAGTDYRRQHVKTTIALNAVDADAGRMSYFHNAGYFALEGDDFAGLFRLAVEPDPAALPLFAELVRVDRIVRRSRSELAALSAALLGKHLARRPFDNPVARFADRVERDLPWLAAQGLAIYHLWAFATLRQLGAAFELAAAHVRWLAGAGAGDLAAAAGDFDAISVGAKALVLKGARAVHAGKSLDARSGLEAMAAAWERGMDRLVAGLGGSGRAA
jgi:hypothetical protein